MSVIPTRRQLFGCAALGVAALGLPNRGLSQLLEYKKPAEEPELIIEPITPSTGQNTPYAIFGNQGPFGRPLNSVQIEPVPGLHLSIYCAPNHNEGRIVVFSHAELSTPQVYENLLCHWASHGFIVVAPLHDDSVLVNGLKAQRQDAKGTDWDLGALLNDSASWIARPRTLRRVLDCIPVLQQQSGIRFLQDRPIVIGHSFGAYAAQLLLGVKPWKTDGTFLDEHDPRFYGGILLSPQGRGILGLRDDSWDSVNRAFMAVSGNGDYGATGQDPSTRIEPFSLSPAGNKHLDWFSHITPVLYTGQQIVPGTQQGLVFQDLLATTTAFLVAYANYDKNAFATLTGNYFSLATDKRITTMYR